MNSRGFSLLQLVMGLAVSGAVAYSVMAITEIQFDIERRMGRRMDRIEIAQRLVLTIADPATCACQLDRTVNLEQASVLGINTTAGTIPDLVLTSWRSNCDFADPAWILASAGETVPGSSQLRVNAIRLKEIQRLATVNTYRGLLEISFDGDPVSVAPAWAQVSFKVDPSSPPGFRRITDCLRAEVTPRLKACPSGYNLVGEATSPTSFCMQPALNPARTRPNAEAQCALTTAPGFVRPGHVCHGDDLIRACLDGRITPGQWEQSATEGTGVNGMILLFGSTCNSTGSKSSGTAPYRCCLRS